MQNQSKNNNEFINAYPDNIPSEVAIVISKLEHEILIKYPEIEYIKFIPLGSLILAWKLRKFINHESKGYNDIDIGLIYKTSVKDSESFNNQKFASDVDEMLAKLCLEYLQVNLCGTICPEYLYLNISGLIDRLQKPNTRLEKSLAMSLLCDNEDIHNEIILAIERSTITLDSILFWLIFFQVSSFPKHIRGFQLLEDVQKLNQLKSISLRIPDLLQKKISKDLLALTIENACIEAIKNRGS